MTPSEYIRSFHDALAISRGMEVRREEYLDNMTFRSWPRPMFTEIFGPIVGLKQEWAEQGATPAELDLSAFHYRRPMLGFVPVNTGWLGPEEEIILKETDDLLVYHDRRGRKMQLAKKTATMGLPIEYPVHDMDDWRKIKSHYQFSEARFGDNWHEEARRHRAEGRVVCVDIPGGYGELRDLMGEEMLALACYDQPELIADMLGTFADTAVRVFQRVAGEVQIDELTLGDDMAGRNGPLLGPKQVREFIVPYYRAAWDVLHERGAKLFFQDSDGDLRPIIGELMDAGINVLNPCEPAAGMDIVQLRRQYGQKLAFYGGIDKHVLRQGDNAITAELEYKLPPMVHSGGCVLGLDHRIPNVTPLAAYRFYINKAWEILEREAG